MAEITIPTSDTLPTASEPASETPPPVASAPAPAAPPTTPAAEAPAAPTTGTPLNAEQIQATGGKYATVEQLAAAYTAAQQKITEQGQAPGAAAPVATEGQQPTQAGMSDEMFDGIRTRYKETGQLGDGDRALLHQHGYRDELINQYITGQQAVGDAYRTAVNDAFGGAEDYVKIGRWSKDNLTPEQFASVNTAIESYDVEAMRGVASQLVARYQVATQDQAPALAAAGPSSVVGGTSPFLSHQAMIAAMKDSRYKSDPAYQQQVADRVRLMKN